MIRKIITVVLILCLLCGCAAPAGQKNPTIYEASYLTLFDTVTIIKGPAESQAEFASVAQALHDEMLRLHQLFDIYHDYEGLNNLKTVNDMAGIQPVQVDSAIIELLTDCKDYYKLTGGRVNVAMGSVLKLWHEARSDGLEDIANARLPDMEALKKAVQHTAIESIVIDEAASTVYISDPEVSLDVGAIAKGWAAQRAAEKAPKGYLMSVGGNVCATGPKSEGNPWVIGVRDPDGAADDYLHTLYVEQGSLVTSGDYQRTYMVDGEFYHHIIDPDTLMPSTYWRSVTILCDDSGLADALSTALFLMDREDGQKLLDSTGAEAMWVDGDGEIFYSPGFENSIRT